MPFEARAIGDLVPTGRWEGPIVSVYLHALNLLHPDGLLVGLVASGPQMSPFSILVPGIFAADGSGTAAAHSLRVGARGSFVKGTLSIGNLVIDIGPAPSWSGSVGPAVEGCIKDPGATFARLQSSLAVAGAEDGLREVVVDGAEQTIFGRRSREILESVEADIGRSVRERGRAAELRGLSGLIGLGIGFTPSGDDFISGLLLARHLVTTVLRIGIDGAELRSALARTNDGGRGLLIAALDDEFPAYLLAFANAIAESERAVSDGSTRADEAAFAAVREAAKYGETSGTDAVTGFAWYLRIADQFLFDEATVSG